MPQAVPFIAKGIAWLAGKTLIATVVRTILINTALGLISKALTKKPRQHAPPINVTVNNPVENRRIVFGRVRVGGNFVFVGTSGDNNKYLWYVVALAGHQVADITDVWLDTNRIASSSIGGGAAEGGAVTGGIFANKLWIYKHRGESAQVSDPELDAAFSNWTGSHRLRGTAYIVVKMERDDEKFPQGAPQNVTALVDGALCYDPRLDSTNGGSGSHRRTDPTTWAFSRNPALHWRWYVSGGSVHNDSVTRLIKYGLREDDSRIDDAYVIAAANECDETLSGANATPAGSATRYRCDLEVSTGETRREILESILATMAGTHTVVHGMHRIYAGAYDTPTHSFTEADLYGELEVEDTVDRDRRYNAVAPVFRDASKEYIEQTGIFRTDASYETQDGGERIPIEIDLRGVTDQYQAQRMAEIHLRRSRMMRTVKLVGALNLLKVAVNETLTFSHTRYGWSSRVFRCVEREFRFDEDAGKVVLTCQREDSAVYADLETADYTTGTSVTDTFVNETPDAPSNIGTTGLQNAILIQWQRPALVFPGTSYQVRESTASSMTSPTTVYEGPDLQFTIAKTVTTSYYYQVRSIRNGQPSAWVPASNGIEGKASSVAAALSASVSPGVASSSTGSASQATNSVTVTATGGTSPYTYAWTWASGGASITIDANTSATTTFSATGLTSGETRTGIARCTVTDNVSATYTVDVDVTISRPAAAVGAPAMTLTSFKISPTDASCAFQIDSDGHWYTSQTTAAPTTDRGLWCNPPEYAADYEVKIDRTGGSETAFTSSPTLGVWHSLGTDRLCRLTESTNGNASKDIVFTISIRRIADSGGLVQSFGNSLTSTVESSA